MTTFDFHRHLWPDELVARLRERSAPPCLRAGRLVLDEGSFDLDPRAYGLDACLRGLDECGLDAAVVSCPPTLGIEALPAEEAGPLVEACHAGMLEAVDAARGRLHALSMGRPAAGFAGTSVSAAAFGDLDALAPVLDRIRDDGPTLVFVHPGPTAPPGRAPEWWTAVVDYTAQMQRAYATWLAHGVDRWPELRVVFAILAGGAPFQLERLRSRGGDDRAALHPNVFLETASYGRRALELCLEIFGAGRLVFGSDAPVLDPSVSLAGIRSFGPAMMEAVLARNPGELVG